MSRLRTGSRPGTHDLTTTSCPVLVMVVEYTRLEVPPVIVCTASTSAFSAAPTLRVSSASSIGSAGISEVRPEDGFEIVLHLVQDVVGHLGALQHWPERGSRLGVVEA